MATSISPSLTPEAAGEISREELLRRLNDPSLLIVDVLPKEAYSSEHLPGAINLPLAEVAQRATAVLPDRTAEIAIYCASFT